MNETLEPAAYYADLAAAYVRGNFPNCPDDTTEAFAFAQQYQHLKLYSFKRTALLPRTKAVLGILSNLWPSNLLDIGSGRGTSLWPMLDGLPKTRITAGDIDNKAVERIQAVTNGGIERLKAMHLDAMDLPFEDKSFDVVTLLEVIEHLENPERAIREAIRVARRAVIASVPSKEDDNPEHIQFFTMTSLTNLFVCAGAKKPTIEFVRNHMIVLASPI